MDNKNKTQLLLAIDVGNSNIKCGVFNKTVVEHQWRMQTDPIKTSDEYGIQMEQILTHFGYAIEGFEGVIISSVVPDMIRKLTASCKRFMHLTPLIVGQDTKIGIDLRVENPKRVGADRIVNAVGGFEKYGGPLITIDIGTAITHDVISSKGEFLGGAIAPGIDLAAQGLTTDTAMLPKISLVYPRQAIGRNTIQAMQTGLVIGYINLIDGITEAIIKELEASEHQKPRVIATGGFSSLLAMNSRYIEKVDRDLTLQGLRIIYERTMAGREKK